MKEFEIFINSTSDKVGLPFRAGNVTKNNSSLAFRNRTSSHSESEFAIVSHFINLSGISVYLKIVNHIIIN